MPGRTDSRGRLLTLLVVFVVVAAALVARLAYWQISQQEALAGMAEKQTSLRVEIPSRRGTIYDRSGTIVLAQTLERDRLVAFADQLDRPGRQAVLSVVGEILDLDAEGRETLAARLEGGGSYVVLARGLDQSASDRIRSAVAGGRISQVALEPEATRVNPHPGGGPETSLAATVLGFVNREGAGQYGIEQRYQDVLAGAPKIVIAQRDAAARAIPETSRVVASGVPGTDLRLTIDAGLQVALEQELLAAWVADHPKSVSAVVMDPWTGEIYAEGTFPSYDGNDYVATAAADPGRFLDPVVGAVYEPGSVMKLLTTLAGLESRTITLASKINDTGKLVLDDGRAMIADADRRAKGLMEVRDGIALSRNVVAARIALGLSETTAGASQALYDVWTRFGLGSPTGIDLAGEVNGLVRDPARTTWQEIDLANASFGQGVAVTQIQLAVAFAALVNGGELLQPRVVKAIGDEELPVVSHGQVMDPAYSPLMQGLMRHVVSSVKFYANRTLVSGYTVGGKTGTAEIWRPEANGGKGAWDAQNYTFSFVGFIARDVDHPDLIVAVRIEDARPTVIRSGQLEMPLMSFELFRRIATDAITRPSLVAELDIGLTSRPGSPFSPASIGGRP